MAGLLPKTTQIPFLLQPKVTLKYKVKVHRKSTQPVNCETKSLNSTQKSNAKELGGVSIRRNPPLSGTDQDKLPRNILEEIVWYKAMEIKSMKKENSIESVTKQLADAPPARDFKQAILQKLRETGRPGLVAEVKKASPSRGVIQPDFDPVKIAKGYQAGGAACLSVLTDSKYFQGSFDNLKLIREACVTCPLLCKEFIVDDYQIYLARANGADAVLLIAAVLPNEDIQKFTELSRSVGMQCLIEVHTVGELARVLEVTGLENHLLGINNRDLQTFKVGLGNTEEIMESEAGRRVLQDGLVMVGESGIFTPEHVAYVQGCGCKGILVGESIVKEGDQETAVKQLLA